MSFSDLPPQETDSLSPGARAYFAEALARSEAAMARVPHVADLAYGPDYWQKLDIFHPPGRPSGLPVILFLHGGGWTHGYKEQCAFMAPLLTALPAVFVSVSYRLAPAVRYPLPLEDTIAALAFVHRTVAAYGGDPDRILLGGHSAGGHLATLATLRRDLRAAAGLPDDVVKACLPVSTTFRFDIGQLEAMGKLFLERPEDAPSISALNFIAGATTRFYIAWGERDFDRVATTSPLAVAALRDEGAPVRSHIFPGADHFAAHLLLGEPGNTWLETVGSMLAGQRE